jgi:hypothetical protein
LTTLVVHCSDGRFGCACDRFVRHRLGQHRYDRLVVPGGAAWLADRPGTGCEAAASRAALGLLVEAHGLRRVVLIAHAGCGWYLQRLGVPPDRCRARQRADLVAVGRWLRAHRPELHVAAYYAERQGRRVAFDPVFGAAGEAAGAGPCHLAPRLRSEAG